MIDTIGLQYRDELSEDDLYGWNINGMKYSRKFNYENKSIFATYCSRNYKDLKPMLRIYFSVPSILHGCNHRTVNISELLNAIPILDELIHKFPILSNLERLSSAQLIRFDACANFKVRELIPDYLDVIKKAKYGKKKKRIYDSTIQFTSREETISFYDKYKRCRHPEAYGLLRLEVQIKKASFVQETLGKEFPTVLELSDELLEGLLQKALDTLGLSGVNICCMTEAEEIIQKAFPERKALRRNMISYLRDTQERIPEYIRANYSPPTLRKYNKLLRDIGVSPYLIDKQIELPPLCLQQKENIFH